MKSRGISIAIGCALGMLPTLVFAGVQISEVQFNPVGTDTGGEYVTIQNTGSTAVSLSGWQLYPDGIGYFVFGDVSIGAASSIIVRLRATGTNSATEIFHSAATSNIGNTSGSVALFNAAEKSASTIQDYVEWGKAGETWESAADSAGIWTKGSFVDVVSATEGQALKRTGSGTSVSAWSLGGATAPAPVDSGDAPAQSSGGSNTSESANAGATSGSGTNSSSSSATESAYRATITADSNVTVGSVTQLTGDLLSPKQESITLNATQYVWNFGDGQIGNGRKVEHIYQHPGTYTISLSVPRDKESLSAYQRITVTSANVRITEALPGADGWIEITNFSAAPLNLSRWLLSVNTSSFMFPAGTVLASGASVVFPSTSTKIVVPSSAPTIVLQLSNGVPADTLSSIALIPSGSSATRSGDVITFGTPTPGAHASGGLSNPAPESPAAKSASAVAKITNVASAAARTVEATIERASSSIAEVQDADVAAQDPRAARAFFGIQKEYYWLLISVLGGAALGSLFYRYRAKRFLKGE